jgi:protein TonB
VTRANELPEHAQEPPPFADIRPRRADNAPGVEATGAHIGDVAADPDAAPPRARRGRVREAATLLAAASVHSLALFALLAAPPTHYGSGGNALDAISVSIVPSTALESRDAVPAATPGAASGYVAPTEGNDEASAKASQEKQAEARPPEPVREPVPESPAEVAEAPAAPPEPAPEAVAAEAPVIVDKPAPPESIEERKVAAVEQPPPPPDKPEARKERDEPVKPPEEAAEAPSPEARQSGGVASRGIAPELPPSPAAAAATPGEVNAYGRAVQEALLSVDQSETRKRLGASRTRGTTVIRITINADGKLNRADVATSSGRPELDEAAVRLVRLTMFPPPPAGLSDSQRIYLAPIVFK